MTLDGADMDEVMLHDEFTIEEETEAVGTLSSFWGGSCRLENL